MTVVSGNSAERSERMPRKKPIRLIAQAELKAVKDLADILRSLHRLLLDHGPPWYTNEVDERLRKALAKADSVVGLRQ